MPSHSDANAYPTPRSSAPSPSAEAGRGLSVLDPSSRASSSPSPHHFDVAAAASLSGNVESQAACPPSPAKSSTAESLTAESSTASAHVCGRPHHANDPTPPSAELTAELIAGSGTQYVEDGVVESPEEEDEGDDEYEAEDDEEDEADEEDEEDEEEDLPHSWQNANEHLVDDGEEVSEQEGIEAHGDIQHDVLWDTHYAVPDVYGQVGEAGQPSGSHAPLEHYGGYLYDDVSDYSDEASDGGGGGGGAPLSGYLPWSMLLNANDDVAMQDSSDHEDPGLYDVEIENNNDANDTHDPFAYNDNDDVHDTPDENESNDDSQVSQASQATPVTPTSVMQTLLQASAPGATLDQAVAAAQMASAMMQNDAQAAQTAAAGVVAGAGAHGGNEAVAAQTMQYLQLFNDPFITSSILAPMNPGLEKFIEQWAIRSSRPRRPRDSGLTQYYYTTKYPCLRKAKRQFHGIPKPFRVEYEDLEGDNCDIQGINWDDIGVSRIEAREIRKATYRNFVNSPGSDASAPLYVVELIPIRDNFFRFKHMDIHQNTHLAHFQLRNLLACASPTQVFYAGKGVVRQFNPISRKDEIVLDHMNSPDVAVSTLDAGHGILVSGNFNGEYEIRHLDSEFDGVSRQRNYGVLTSNSQAITNHVELQIPRRSSAPQACFASNDCRIHILDVATDTILSRLKFKFPINCSAVSPDGQLRVLVGDNTNVLITQADGSRTAPTATLRRSRSRSGSLDAGAGTGARRHAPTVTATGIEQKLGGHSDHGFACAWADDGWTMATSFQDRIISVWDARNWNRPVKCIRTEMSGARSLRFSPAGSGPRVLVAAEEADYVNIIDARTFESRQTIDFFGEIGGIAFEPREGRDLFVLSADSARGGIIKLERRLDTRLLAEEMDQYEYDPHAHRRHGELGLGDVDRDAPKGRDVYYTDTSRPGWIEENLSAAARRSRAANARRRHREAALVNI